LLARAAKSDGKYGKLVSLFTTLVLAMSGLVLSPAHAATPSNGTYLCTTGLRSSSTPNFTITNGVVTNGGSCAGAVVIPASVTSIGAEAFIEAALTSITIPASVTSIGEEAFAYATSLTSITVAGTNPNYSSANGVLFNKLYKTLITYPAGKTVTSYSIPASVTSIGEGAFIATALTSITIPASVTSIGAEAFEGATSLATVTFGSGSKLTSIGAEAFGRATSLASITIPASVTSIGAEAFNNATSLATVTFGSGSKLTSIGDYAFESSAITSITIPAGVTSIGEGAFNNATSLTSITVADANPNYSSAAGVLFNKDATTLISYPVGKTETSYAIPASVTSISFRAFRNATSLTSITIPASVTSIGAEAFGEATSLATVTFGSGSKLITIGEGAFYPATSLTSITIPASVTSIGERAFFRASSLNTVTFESGSKLITIGEEAFAYATSLTSITIPASVTSIGSYAFVDATSLTSITIPASVTSIGEVAFAGATSLDTVTFESDSQLASIGRSAFQNAAALTSITIPAGVTSIGGSAFAYATSINSVYFLGNAPTSVGGATFIYVANGAKAYIKSGNTSFGSAGSYWNGLEVAVGIHTVSYNTSGGSAVTAQNYGGYIATPTSPTRTGYALTGWSLTDGGSVITFPHTPDSTGDVTLYATWTLHGNYTCTTGELLEASSSTPSFTITNGVVTNGYSCVGAVVIPEGVTRILFNAFAGATSLTSVTIPASVTYINPYTFDGATSLTSITVDEENLNYSSVSGVLFDKNAMVLIAYPTRKSGTSYTIPASVTYIQDDGFDGATSLTSITIPASVIDISSDAFDGATSLTSITVDEENLNYSSASGVLFDKNAMILLSYPAGKSGTSYTIPASVTTITSYAFDGATSLTSITIPEGVTNIHDTAFWNATSLTSITVDEENLYYISVSGVLFNKDFTDLITYPAGKSGTSYTIPASVASIEYRAFSYTALLTSITIPASVTSIGDWAFEYATALTSITVAGANPNYSSAAGVLFNKDATTLISYPSGKSGASYTIPASVASIEYRAFSYTALLTSVTIPASVTNIDDSAFRNAISLTSITVAGANPNYSSDAGVLFNKDATTLIRYPAGKIGTSYTITANVTSIGDEAFRNATSLTSITIPASVIDIGEQAFEDAASLTSVYFLGNDPDEDDSFDDVATGATAYIKSGATGFGTIGSWAGLVVTIGVYTVTYNTSGGSLVGAQDYGANIATPTSPTRTGYTFAGWSATDGGSVITFPHTPASGSDVTLYAKWTQNPARAQATVKPSVSGTAKVSKILTTKKGTWTGYPTPSAFTYQWYSCTKQVNAATQTIPSTCKSISKATKSTLAVTSSFKGKYLAVAVTGTSTGTSATKWLSKSTAIVK